jgi:flagellar basal-body rod modification protein FlgD
MSTISSISSGYPTTATAETGSSELGKDTFLRLLTTQLQNQDPLNPISNEAFIAQLAQFSSLEQLQGVNSQLESLNLINSSMNNASMVNLLGQEVVAVSDTFHYDGEGEQQILFDAASSFESATVTIRDEEGNVVDTVTLSHTEEGEQSFTWDGQGNSGQLAEGNYSFTVTATDINGNNVSVTGLIQGIVDEMSFANGLAEPSINGVAVSIGNIIRLSTVDDASTP